MHLFVKRVGWLGRWVYVLVRQVWSVIWWVGLGEVTPLRAISQRGLSDPIKPAYNQSRPDVRLKLTASACNWLWIKTDVVYLSHFVELSGDAVDSESWQFIEQWRVMARRWRLLRQLLVQVGHYGGLVRTNLYNTRSHYTAGGENGSVHTFTQHS